MNAFILVNQGFDLQCYEYPVQDSEYVVMIIHGLAEHGKRYHRFCEELNGQGISAVTMDLRGHGESIGYGLGYFAPKDGWKIVLDDIHALYSDTRTKHPHAKIVLFGHSMGSIFSRCVLQTTQDVYHQCILSGVTVSKPGLRDVAPALAGFIALFNAKGPSELLNTLSFGAFNQAFENPRTEFDWLSRDPDQVDLYVNDDKCGFVASARMFQDVASALNYSLKENNVQKMPQTCPIYILSGEKDPCGSDGYDAQYLYDTYTQAGLDVQYHVYEGARHELLNETNAQDVMNDIIQFIQQSEVEK